MDRVHKIGTPVQMTKTKNELRARQSILNKIILIQIFCLDNLVFIIVLFCYFRRHYLFDHAVVVAPAIAVGW